MDSKNIKNNKLNLKTILEINNSNTIVLDDEIENIIINATNNVINTEIDLTEEITYKSLQLQPPVFSRQNGFCINE